MASHRRWVRHLSRDYNARKALLVGLTNSLIEKGRIKTTLVKAKETRRMVERLITFGKKKEGSVAGLRILISRLNGNEANAKKIVQTLVPRFKQRPGGYTRIVKIGPRVGDRAPMAVLELVE
ncbi:MAG: 50S ribosomal protein L17 [Bdellovibrionaceae bacterium]|nr:50S ribosomal protein L17 [Pseudobdellovibrionaceae bacterium]MDW8190877.1 50S ribosomal protein L17 [Pseudobdellovibrionaceae bacterium]